MTIYYTLLYTKCGLSSNVDWFEGYLYNDIKKVTIIPDVFNFFSQDVDVRFISWVGQSRVGKLLPEGQLNPIGLEMIFFNWKWNQ